MPSLIKAYRLQEKTAQFGFEWDDIAEVKAKVDEELSELDEAIQLGVQEDIEDEYGDVLFALVNYSRYLKIDPEAALEKSNRKFKHRFQYIEEQAQYQGKDLKDMTLAEMDALWNEAKKKAVKTDRL
jgi:XTP/dITP diphosphohydrolase